MLKNFLVLRIVSITERCCIRENLKEERSDANKGGSCISSMMFKFKFGDKFSICREKRGKVSTSNKWGL
jgi:hypothetical protein